MKSIDFPEANVAIAKDQPQYGTLYAFADRQPEAVVYYTCYELTDEEIDWIVKNKKLFYRQVTGGGFQPMNIFAREVFSEPIRTEKVPADENRTPAEEWDKTHWLGEIKMLPQHGGGTTNDGNCLNCGKTFQEHFWSTRQCEL